ncbi:MAG: sulfur carrier protein ThiS [Bacteroidetes bacterium]|nr:sulfur carrier protein ThiS [Bacteroidota bacterium]
MIIFVNEKEKRVRESQSLDSVLQDIGLQSTKGVAVAVNDIVVPKSQWDLCIVHENDRLTIIHATQGG